MINWREGIIFATGCARRTSRFSWPCFSPSAWAAPSLAANGTLRNWYERLLQRPAFATAAAEIHSADLALSSPVPGAYPDHATIAVMQASGA